MNTTTIPWTHHTFNPWWGCEKVSEACAHCYAEAFSKRVGFGGSKEKIWGKDSARRFFGEKHWREPLKWSDLAGRASTRHRVFCASMADVFEDRRDLDPVREKLWDLIERTKHLDWLLLTKRPVKIQELYPWARDVRPPPNVWLGTTAETQAWFDIRWSHLEKIPAVVRFISHEPGLGFVWPCGDTQPDWFITGGESLGGRPYISEDSLRVLRDACQTRGIAFFLKQMGSAWARARKTADKKGENPSEWPEDLRVREFPTPRAI